jgi:hypothetical protein
MLAYEDPVSMPMSHMGFIFTWPSITWPVIMCNTAALVLQERLALPIWKGKNRPRKSETLTSINIKLT